MKLTFKKLALLGLSIVAMFFMVGCTDTTTEGTGTTLGLTDQQKVQAVLDGISLGDITALTDDLTLPTPTTNGVSVVWTTSNADVIAMNGEVTIPSYTDGNKTATLTVTVTLNEATVTKTFDVTVLAETVEAFLNRIATSIVIDSSDSIVANFELPSTAQGATVSWTSSNATMVAISATVNDDGLYEVTVTRPKAEEGGVNTSVTLTATISLGEESITVDKSLRIIAEPLAKIYTSFETLHGTALLNEYVDLTGVVYAKFKLGYFMTDGTGHYIAIYTTEDYTADVEVGDEVRIKGKYAVYQTLYQISSLTYQEVIDHDNALNITPTVLTDATDLLDVDSTNRLIHGQTYTITVTPQLRGSHNNVYLYAGETQVATVYYNATPASIDALEEVVGKVVTIDVVYYTFYSGSSVLVSGVPEVYIIFDGLEDDIELAPLFGQEALDADTANLSLSTTAVGGQSFVLPTEGGYESAISWAIKSGSEYATITGDTLTMAEVSAAQTVVVTATLTIDGVTTPATKDFTIAVTPITTSTIDAVWDMEADDLAQVEGTVYFFINNGYYVFDGTGMIFIYTTAPAGTELGDKLVIFGTVAIYKEQYQITNAVVKDVVSEGNAYEQTAIDYVPGTTALVSGQTYSVTATITELTEGGYTNLFLYDGDTRLAQIYYRSTINDSFAALTANKGKEATINVVYYYTSDGLVYFVYQEGADGIELTPLVGQEALDADAAAIILPTTVIGGQSVSLPDEGGYGSAIAWTVKTGSEYASIADGKVTFIDVTAAQSVVLTASLTITGVATPTTKDFTIAVNPITTSTIAQVKEMEVNSLVQVEGTVYFFISNGYYVFDGTGMIFVYATAPEGTLLGDKVVIFGTLGSYNSQLQIKNAILKSTVSTGNVYEQTAIEYVPGTTPLVSGQTYSVTATITITGSYSNVYLFDGATNLAVIEYHSTINNSYNALKAEVGNEVVLNVVYYYTGYDKGTSSTLVTFVYQEGADGIVYTPEQQAALDVDAIEISTSVVSGDVEALPATSGTSTIIWTVKDANVNATIDAGNVTYAEVASATQVTLVATVTYTPTVGDPIVTPKEFVVTISTYAEKIAEDKAALTVALTANEFDVVTLPDEGVNGSTITWALTATDNATLDVNVLTLEYFGTEYSVTVTATLSFTAAPTVTDTKEFTIVVSPVTVVTEFLPLITQTSGAWTTPNTTGIYVKGVVTGFNGSNGFFIQDENGDPLYVYSKTLVASVAKGDEVVVLGNLVDYKTEYAIEYRFREIDTVSLKATLSQGNDIFVSVMTIAEIESMNFYENIGRVMEVTGFVVSFDTSNIYFNWKLVSDVQYRISGYNSLAPWLRDVYENGDVLPAVQFTLTNISSSFDKVYAGNLVIEMTDQQAVDYDKTLVTSPVELTADYVFPTAKYGSTYTIKAGSISTELAANITEAGVVTLPESADAVGTMTITVTKGLVSADVVINLTVKALTDAQKLAMALEDIPASMTYMTTSTDVALPTLLYGSYTETTIATELMGVVSITTDTYLMSVVLPTGTAPAVGIVTIEVTVGAEVGTKDVTISVRGAAAPSDLFFSEYIEGGSYNKAFEIYNGTGVAIDLSNYTVELYFNGSSTVGKSLSLTGTLLSGEVFVVAYSQAVTAVLDLSDVTNDVANFNGDDALVMKNGTTIIDSIGQVGVDPGSAWTANSVSTANMTLVRIATVTSGDTNTTDVYDPSTQWVAYAQDTFTYLGSHTMTPAE